MAEIIDDNQERFIKDAVQQFVDAQIEGQQPDLDEFVKKYPEFEHQIRQMIQNVRKIDELFASLTHAEESGSEAADESGSLVGQKLGGFEIREMIGRGGMGVVYLAHDTRLDRSVAIKSMPPELMDSATTRTRFQREAKLLASLNHPNIAVIHDIIEQESLGYLVLEYVPGQTLAERITKGPLKLQETLTIALQVAEAVAAAHERDVIHRDLKPGNIKLAPDGRVKVLDFGLAKASGSQDKNQDTAITQPGRVIGTPAYMSPEQACGKETDHRTDIWSFGCLMYEMLSGHPPFESETATEILARIIEREPDWEMLPQDTPSNIRVLLRRCLEKDPRRRLQHIADAVIEINETLISSPVRIPLKLRRMAMIIGAAIIVVLSGVAVWITFNQKAQPSAKEIRLVVLPFENLGPAADSYFATGLTDEVTTRLAGVHGLRVYKNRDGVATRIIKELGVDYILEGTIQRARPSDPNSPVRIRPQLFRASDDSLVWAKPYDNEMSEVLQIQSDLAEEVSQVLDITLLGPERNALQSRPTENTRAYEYYLRGNEYFRRSYLENDVMIAIRMYEKTVDLDPLFAQAYARLSEAHLQMYWFNYDHSEQRLGMAKKAADKAFQLNPNLSEVRLALGDYYFHGLLDYDRALEEFEIARKSQPNNSELLSMIGFVQRRQGKIEEALSNIKRSAELDPLSHNLAWEVGVTFLLLRKYEEAEHYIGRAIELAPDRPIPYSWKVKLYLFWEGKTEKARAVLEEASQNIGALEDRFTVLWSVLLDMFDGDYQKALAQLSLWKLEAFNSQFYFIPKAQLYAQIHGLMGNQQLEQAYYESARNILETKIQQRPEDARFHSSLGIAYAGLDRKEDAIREGQLAVELLPVTKEAWGGLYRVEDLAHIYLMVGEFDAAIDQLESLLSRPGELSIPLLRLDPAWDPLRNHPRFKKLLKSDK